MLGYHPSEAVQLRLKGRARVLAEDALTDEAWARSTAFARRCYLAVQPPGTVMAGPGSGLPPEVEGVRPSEAELVPARANFALVLVEVEALDWLHLAHSGHRRARFVRAGGGWAGDWVAP